MPDALADVTDVETLWRPLSATESEKVSYLLEIAGAQLRQRLKGLDARLALFNSDPDNRVALDPLLVVNALVGAVRRVLDNPTGALSRTVTTGPYSETIGYGERTGRDYIPRGALIITDDDIRPLIVGSGGYNPGPLRMGGDWSAC